MRYVAATGKHVYSKQMGKFVTCVRRSWLQEGAHVVRLPLWLQVRCATCRIAVAVQYRDWCLLKHHLIRCER
jgi:hypothetical protein